MKALLGCLMCLVLTWSQAFAISGGPFGGSQQVNVVGTYAGALVPIVDPVIGLSDNSLALFTMKVPQTGLATGTVAVFRNGFIYTGGSQDITTGGDAPGIVGTVDPVSARLSAVVVAKFLRSVIVDLGPPLVTGVFRYEAQGTFDAAKIVTSDSNGGAVRIKGRASLTYRFFQDPLDPLGNSGGPVPYKIRGFKQSESTS